MAQYEQPTVPKPQIKAGGRRALQVGMACLLLLVLASFSNRLAIDLPNLAAGTLPPDQFDHRYVEHPWLAYLHILPGVLYLLLAPLQLAHWFRRRHYTVHRRLGRMLAGAAMLSGVFALIFGGGFAFGGLAEASAAVVFGAWFLVCLVVAVRAIRRGDIVQHRRWMIRAFAMGIGVGMVRVWLIVFQAGGLLSSEASFGLAFWVGFSLHALIAELWIRAYPDPPELARPSPNVPHSVRR